MPHKSQYAIIPQAISHDDCDFISDLGERLKKEKAEIRGGKTSHMRHVRNSTIAWFTNPRNDQETKDMGNVYSIIDSAVMAAAQDMDLTHWNITDRQNFQYTVYTKGQYYDWHRDTFDDPHDEPWKGLMRKLSFTLLLNDPQEYENGQFELDTSWKYGPHESWNRHFVLEELFNIGKGSMIVFQSQLWHRVRPVKSGKRKTLVGWYLGPPFV